MLSTTSRKISFVLVAALIAVLALASMGADSAAVLSTNCTGTYLVDLPTSQGIWTLFKDGNFQGTDSAEDFWSFSHGQGSWKYSNGATKMSYLDYDVDGVEAPTGMARFDATLTFSNQCRDVSGVGTLYFFDTTSGGDPLNINTAFGTAPGINFTGRRLNVTP